MVAVSSESLEAMTDVYGPDDSSFSPIEILLALERRHVRYVVIGGFAAVIHGYPLTTFDLDITPATDKTNRNRLLRCLRDLGATLVREGKKMDASSREARRWLQQAGSISARTAFGMLDIEFMPSGTRGYSDLHRYSSKELVADGLSVSVAALADVIRSKEAAGRPQDLAQLPALRATLEVVDALGE